MPLPLALLALDLQASAHVGDVIDTTDLHVDTVDPSLLHVQSTFGLLTYDGSQATWVCHEAVTAPGVFAAPFYAQGASGDIVSWSIGLDTGRDGHPVWRTQDRCDWQPVPGLTDQVVAQVDLRDGEVWAATATSDAVNGLYRTVDGTFQLSQASAPALFTSVHASGPAVWAVSSDGGALALWHSTDGVTFSSSPVPVPEGLTEPLRGRIHTVDPGDPQRAWFTINPIGTDLLATTADGGQTVQILWHAPDRITDVERGPDGTLWVVLNDRQLWRQAPGDAFVQLDVLETSGVVPTEAGLWSSHRAFFNGALISRRGADDELQLLLGPDVITAPHSCPDGSDQAEVCAPLWPQLEPRLAPPLPEDTGPTVFPPATLHEDDDAACGCRAPATPVTWGLALLCGAFARRRKRR